ncbi:MAG TPA: hypothetical protein VE990_19535 [Acidimicrobiales bacterium]|nr:hypothetical protein [Acidimicrobiales bacterium]
MASPAARSRLFHFSDDPGIDVFVPRPVQVPSPRQPGSEWLNGPLVWAVDESRQATYLFPRDCPRILLWPTSSTSAGDLERWWGDRTATMIAHVEWAWLAEITRHRLYRYELPPQSFVALDDAWMWVSPDVVTPIGRDVVADLPAALAAEGVELRVMESLTPLRGVWTTTLHASGIRLRNAKGWPPGE